MNHTSHFYSQVHVVVSTWLAWWAVWLPGSDSLDPTPERGQWNCPGLLWNQTWVGKRGWIMWGHMTEEEATTTSQTRLQCTVLILRREPLYLFAWLFYWLTNSRIFWSSLMAQNQRSSEWSPASTLVEGRAGEGRGGEGRGGEGRGGEGRGGEGRGGEGRGGEGRGGEGRGGEGRGGEGRGGEGRGRGRGRGGEGREAMKQEVCGMWSVHQVWRVSELTWNEDKGDWENLTHLLITISCFRFWVNEDERIYMYREYS